MNTSSAPLFAVFIKQASLTTNILVALGLGFGIPAFADGGAVGLTNSNQPLQCVGTVQHNLQGNGGTNLCPAPSATAVRSYTPNPTAFGGNPINLLTGNKFEQLLDIDDVGDAFALRLHRYYNSRSTQRGIFGIGWRSDYELQLQDLGDNVQILGADGTLYHFNKQQIKDDDTGLFSERFVFDDLSLGYVVVKPIHHTNHTNHGGVMWQWHLPDGRVMTFIPHRQVDKVNAIGRYQYGQLSRVQKRVSGKNTQTLYWQLHYNTDGKLALVSNHLGWMLRFEYKTDDKGLSYVNVSKETQSGRLSGSDKPNSSYHHTQNKQVWQYRLDKDDNLSKVITHQGDKFSYEYTDPNDKHNLTAKYRHVQDKRLSQKDGTIQNTDTDGMIKQLISRFAYDEYDRAILSTGEGDVGKISISYDDKATYPTLGKTYTNTLTNSLGQITKYHYTYDKTGIRLLSVIGVGCMTCNQDNVRYEYNKQGWVIAKHTLNPTNANTSTPTKFIGNDTNITSRANIISSKYYVYDDFGRVIKMTFKDKLTHKQGNTNTTTNTYYTYASNNKDSPAFYLIKSISTNSVFDGKQTGVEYNYDDEGNVIKVREFGYEGGGVPINIEHHLDYDAHGQPTQVYQLDGLGNRTLITKYTWLKAGVLQQIDEPLKNTTTTFYHNDQGLIVKLVRTQGDDELRFDFDYDDKGQAKSVARYINGSLAGQVAYERDEFGQIAKVLDGNGQDLVFNALNVGVNQGALFDAVMMADFNQNTQTGQTPILSAFNKNTLRFTLADGSQAVYQPDDFGRILAITHPQVGTHQYAYDSQGNLSQILLSDGRRIVYHYNDKGLRIKKEVYHNNQPTNTPNINTQDTHIKGTAQKLIAFTTWQYDDKDRLISMTDDAQTVHYAYDNDNNVIQKTLQPSGLDKPLITKFGYQKDKDGKTQMVSITLPDGTVLSSKNNVISYQTPKSKHKSALLTRQTSNTQTGQVSHVLGKHITQSQHYDKLGNWTGLSYQPAQTSNKAKITNNQHKDELLHPLFSQHWQRGDNGLIDAITEQDQQGIHAYHYLYDDNNALILSKQNSPQAKHNTYYAYDKLGNRVASQSKSSVGMMSMAWYHYDNKGRITGTNKSTHANTGATSTENKTTSPSIQYDNTGKPITYGKYALHYHNGRLSEVRYKDGRPVASYRYNELGQRVQKISHVNAKGESILIPTTTHYVYEDSLLQHELDGKGNITRHYVYVGDKLIATMDYDHQEQDSQNIHAQDKDNHTTNTAKQEGLWQTLKDKFGNRAKDGQANNQQTVYANTPKIHYVITDHLGRPRQVLDDNNELVWQLTPTDFGGMVDKALQDKTGYELNLRFSGQYFDKETGLYYNHHRYYDPATGRYLTPDPLGLAGGDNLYTYVANSPIHYNDPVGLLLFAFDGTGNRDYRSNALSNVVKFRNAYTKDPNEPYFPNAKWRGQKNPFPNHMKNNNIFYISGAGTEDYYTQIGSNETMNVKLFNVIDLGVGNSLTNRVDQMLIYMSEYLDKVIAQRKEKQTKSDTHITLDIVGFSRGAASARMFASKLENLLSKDYSNKHPYQLPLLNPQYQSTHGTYRWKHGINNLCGIKIKFNFMGLWDTVPSYGTTITDDSKELAGKGYAITVSSKWNKVVHAVAVNEHRSGFAVRSIFNNQNQAKTYANSSNRIERGFMGAHSDIGGGYAIGDLSDTSLMWVVNQAEKSSIKIDRKFLANNHYNTTHNPVIHDNVGVYPLSQYSPSRQFLWATDGKGISQFESIAHLKLNWKDTLQFENDKSKKFEKVKRYSEEYLKLSQLPACSRKDDTCPVRSITNVMNDYKKIKANYDKEILHDTTANERIKLAEYKKWLRRNGYEID